MNASSRRRGRARRRPGLPALASSPTAARRAAAGRAAGRHRRDWLDRPAHRRLIHNDQFDFDDYGLTADTALALEDDRRPAGRPCAQIRNALATHVDSWTTGVDFGSGDVYAGSVAKALVLAQSTGAEPDVLRRRRTWSTGSSRGSATAARPSAGSRTSRRRRLRQHHRPVLRRARPGRAGAAKAAGPRRSCSSSSARGGFFRLDFAEADRDRPGLRRGTAATSAPDTDVTALAVSTCRRCRRKPRGRQGRDRRRDRLAQAHQKAQRQLRRRHRDRGQQHQQHRPGRLGARPASAPAGRPSKAAAWVRGLQVAR